MWTAAPIYEELNNLVTQTEACINSSLINILFSVPSELKGTICAVNVGLHTAWDKKPACILGLRKKDRSVFYCNMLLYLCLCV
jgi:hypothetical protein